MTTGITLDTFAESLWKHLRVTKKTLANYKGTYRLHISPSLGTKPIGQVTKKDLLEVLAPLSPHTYYQTLMSCRVIYREAADRELIEKSPVSLIKAPKLTNKPYKFLTWEQVESTNFGKYDEQIKFLALHGLRWGEAVALTKEDIYEQKVHVTKSIHGATKTHAGVRVVPYLGHFEPLPRTPKPLRKALQPYGVNIHSLRKTYAYFLKSNDVHVTTAAKFLGHSNPLVTLKIYTLVRDNEVTDVGNSMREKLSMKAAEKFFG
jgi:integrase